MRSPRRPGRRRGRGRPPRPRPPSRRSAGARAPDGSPGRSSASPGRAAFGTAPAGRHDRRAAPLRLLLLVAGLLLLGRELRLGLDVDPPAGQARGEARVLALAADRQRELVVGDDDGRLLALVVDEDLAHARGRERLGDEAGGLVVVGDDVDLLAAQLGDDHPHARAARADAGADGVDAVGVRDDRDLRAVAGLAGDVRDLDEAVGDLGDLELEELLDQLRVAARDDDRRALRRGRDLLDDGLDALGVVVALAVDLLGLGQQRLDALAQLDERVAAVGLLDDAGDELADAVAVLLEHHVALGLADALEDDLLGRLRGDPAEVAGRDVALLDLVLVLLELLRVDLGVLGLDHLAGLGVEVGALVDRLDDEVRLEALGDDQLDDAEVRRSRGRARRARTSRCRAASCRPTGARPRARGAASRARCPSRAPSTFIASRISRDIRSTPRRGWNDGCRRTGSR